MASLIFHAGVLIGLPIVTVFLVRQYYVRRKSGTPRPEPPMSGSVDHRDGSAPAKPSTAVNIGQITLVNSIVVLSSGKSGKLSASKELLQLMGQSKLKPRTLE